LETRRTRPAYLSEAKAARDRERTERMVKSIIKGNQVTRVGETSNFFVDYDNNERLVMVYGKEAQTEFQFKLALNKNETKALVKLLISGLAFFPKDRTK
jgi:hypothetical protein